MLQDKRLQNTGLASASAPYLPHVGDGAGLGIAARAWHSRHGLHHVGVKVFALCCLNALDALAAHCLHSQWTRNINVCKQAW